MKRIIIAIVCVFTSSHCYGQFNTITAEKAINKTQVEVEVNRREEKEEKNIRRYGMAYPLRQMVVTSAYGYRNDPYTKKKTFHNGIDLRANYEEVYSMMGGEVIKVSEDTKSGRYVIMQYGDFTVSYCHLSQVEVHEGEYLYPGERIGYSGNTGRSTGPHLHITCRYKGRYIDPRIMIEVIDGLDKRGQGT